MKHLFSLLFASIPLVGLAADAQLSAIDYLNKMGTALQTLNYHGTLVYIHDGVVESMQLIHKNDADGEFERLVHLSGEPREVIRDNDVVTCYLPDSQSVTVGERRFNNHLLVKLTNNLDKFAPNYSFGLNGTQRVAGKTARAITIDPKDPYRYGYRVWVDENNGLLLKSELLDAQGEVLEQMMFAQLQVVDEIPQELLKPGVSGDKFTWHGKKSKTAKVMNVDQGWQVAQLPSGFSVSGHFKQMMPNSEQPAEHMVVSDGLASVSIYIEPFNAESQAFVGASRMGAINVYGSVFEDFQITVIGEVPESTVEMIAQSIKYQPHEVK
ncbi:MucB/RseB C-terminal domain-containing protein [Kaarinaea lacus]